MARRVGVDAEALLGVERVRRLEETGSGGERLRLGGADVLDVEVEVHLLRHPVGGPGRGHVVGGVLVPDSDLHTSHTSCMKVAVSLPDELFQRADESAARLGVNRSQLYARALEDFLRRQGSDPVTARLDELAAEGALPEGAVAGRRLIDGGAWEW